MKALRFFSPPAACGASKTVASLPIAILPGEATSASTQKKGPTSCFQEMGRKPGDVLLSHNLEMHYHRGCSVSLPCSEWERVVPLRWDHQKSDEFEATLRLNRGGSHWGERVEPQIRQISSDPLGGFCRRSRAEVGRSR